MVGGVCCLLRICGLLGAFIMGWSFDRMWAEVEGGSVGGRVGEELPLRYPTYSTPLGINQVFYKRYSARIYNAFRLPMLTGLASGRRRFMVSFVGSDKDLGSVTGGVKIDCPAIQGMLSSLVSGLGGVR